jgi:uncharacterized protein YlxW (UPF0749 family)
MYEVMEYRDIAAAATAQFEREDRSIEQEQTELAAARAQLNRRKKALGRKRAKFERVMRNFRELDDLLESGQERPRGSGQDEAAA